MRRVVITGAGGFVGSRLVARLAAEGWHVDAIVRRPMTAADAVHLHVIDDLAQADPALLARIFKGADAVVHLAALVPGKRANGGGITIGMARQVASAASLAGVPRLLVLSSIYASLAAKADPAARAYGVEKYEADVVIQEIAGGTVPTIFLAPPVVYGEGMSGSLGLLAKLARSGLPLPLQGARALRDYISLDNLVDAIVCLLQANEGAWQKAGERRYEPSDGQAIGTADLVRALGRAQGRRTRLVPFPARLLRLAGKLTGREEAVSGALDDLRVSASPSLAADFGWVPKHGFPESLSFLSRPSSN